MQFPWYAVLNGQEGSGIFRKLKQARHYGRHNEYAPGTKHSRPCFKVRDSCRSPLPIGPSLTSSPLHPTRQPPQPNLLLNSRSAAQRQSPVTIVCSTAERLRTYCPLPPARQPCDTYSAAKEFLNTNLGISIEYMAVSELKCFHQGKKFPFASREGDGWNGKCPRKTQVNP